MKYYKFYLSTFTKKIADTLTAEQYVKCHKSGYPVDGPVFVPCEFISKELYKECKDYEDNLNPYK